MQMKQEPSSAEVDLSSAEPAGVSRERPAAGGFLPDREPFRFLEPVEAIEDHTSRPTITRESTGVHPYLHPDVIAFYSPDPPPHRTPPTVLELFGEPLDVINSFYSIIN